MTLAHGRSYAAIPGPSVVPDRVLAAMHRASPNIYGGPLHDLVASLWPDLRLLAGTTQNVALYICNGHGLWEAVNTNLFSRGDKVLVLATGVFGLGWAEACKAIGVDVEVLDCGRVSAPDPERLMERLRADTDRKIKAVFVTHVDTASTVKADIAALGQVIKTSGHPALFGVDCIASMGCDPFRMDEWGVDIAIAASQKGLMLPPGIGFVWFSDRARLAGQNANCRTPYWDWGPRAAADEFWQYWHGTPPTHHLYGLRESLTMLLHEEGLAAAWSRHERLARAVWTAFEFWGQGGTGIRMNVARAKDRSHAVTAGAIPAPDAERLRDWCETQAGVTLGIGLGMAPQSSPEAKGFFRLAHMGHVNAHMTLGALSVMEAGMHSLGIPYGAGALPAAVQSLTLPTPEKPSR